MISLSRRRRIQNFALDPRGRIRSLRDSSVQQGARIDLSQRLCYNEIMAEEKETPELTIDDTLSADDTDVLRAVLEDSHTRGITPVSVYNQSAEIIEEFE